MNFQPGDKVIVKDVVVSEYNGKRGIITQGSIANPDSIYVKFDFNSKVFGPYDPVDIELDTDISMECALKTLIHDFDKNPEKYISEGKFTSEQKLELIKKILEL